MPYHHELHQYLPEGSQSGKGDFEHEALDERTQLIAMAGGSEDVSESTQDATARTQSDADAGAVETLDVLRRRIRFRAWHRGTSEADLLLGGFVNRTIDGLAIDELGMLDRLLQRDDPIIDDWVRGRRATPAEYDNSILKAFRRFCLAPARHGGSHERPHGD
jgi:antitoxin CptB